MRWLLPFLLLPSLAFAGALSDLKPPKQVPEPSASGCPVPPIPSGEDRFTLMRAEGWSLDLGKLWREWDLNGHRYSVEYGIRSHDGKAVVPTVFPQRYNFDLNRDGVFEASEIWLDVKGDGRCADLRALPVPQDPEPKKPNA